MHDVIVARVHGCYSCDLKFTDERHVWLRRVFCCCGSCEIPVMFATRSYVSLMVPSICRASEEAFVAESDGDSPGSEWERVARLCDFNPKTNKQAKDVSRMRSVLISLKQAPLVR